MFLGLTTGSYFFFFFKNYVEELNSHVLYIESICKIGAKKWQDYLMNRTCTYYISNITEIYFEIEEETKQINKEKN